jgi:uncharacterized protein YciI
VIFLERKLKYHPEDQMNKYILQAAVSFVILTFCTGIFGQNTAKAALAADGFDAEAAKRVGADEYGMKQYVFAILRTGKAKRPGGKEMEALQAGHLKNILRLADEGKLVMAGPFLDDQDMRGLFIFNVKTVDEAKKLVESDPMIAGGYLVTEFHPWYGSAALVDVNQMHKKIQKKKIVE